jgi:hypothetical protein
MGALADVVRGLSSFERRGPCTDAERRAALWLHDDLRARGHEAWVETVWVRPQWWWSLIWHALLGIAASVLSTGSTGAAVAGVAVAGVAFGSYALEVAGGPGLLRLALFRRATQLVVVAPPDPDAIALHLVANTDAPRRGLVFRDGWRRVGGRLRPGPLWWVVILLGLVTAGTVARLLGAEGTGIGVAQLVPSLGLVLVVAAALDIALSGPGPGASDDASGVALAMALHDELVARPPERLSAALVLAGAGELFPYGFRRHLRADRPRPHDTVVLELGPAGAGTPAWTTRHAQLTAACIAAADQAVRHRVNRPTAVGAARLRRIPGVEVRCVDARGIPPRARTERDVPDAVDEDAMQRALAFCLAVVEALDADLAGPGD